MKFKFRSIKTKILFWFGGFTILILILFNITFYHFLEQNTKLSIQNKLYHKAVFINNNILANTPLKELLEDKELEFFDIAVVKDEKVISKKGETYFNPLLKYVKEKKSFYVFSRGDKLDGLYIFRIYNPYKGAILFYERDLDDKIDSKLQEVKEILFVLEPILLFILIFMAAKVTDKILKSINKITTTANKIYVNDFSNEIPPPKYSDEIKDLVDSFNKMINRLKNGVKTLEQFNSDVSHELKTPLTAIRGEIEIALNKKRDEEYYIKSLKTIEKETIQIQKVVDNMLLLTKYTKENIKQTFEKLSFDSLLLDVIDKFSYLIKQKEIKLHILKFESVNIEANYTLLSTMVSNLLDNSIKYSNSGTNIYISLFKKDEKTHLIIKDEGIGISKENLEKVQERFFRVDQSRSKKIKGFGLGLSIVKNCVKLHNGTLNLSSKMDKGTKVEIIL